MESLRVYFVDDSGVFVDDGGGYNNDWEGNGLGGGDDMGGNWDDWVGDGVWGFVYVVYDFFGDMLNNGGCYCFGDSRYCVFVCFFVFV